MTTKHWVRLGLAASWIVAVGCGDDGGGSGTDPECVGGKCDVPGGPADQNCEARQAEVLSSSNRGFTPEGIRWACADVDGVIATGSDDDPRGQEYCEYFAVVNVPTADGVEPLDFGRVLTSSHATNTTTELALCIEDEGTQDCRATISIDQLDEIIDTPEAVVGACVFTSWHADVSDPLPVCEGASGCALDHEGVAVSGDRDFLGMKGIFNNNGAANALVRDCANLTGTSAVPEPDLSDPDNPNNEPFFRGCLATAQGGAGVEWRRSDPSICASVIRTLECNCSAPGVSSGQDLADAVIPDPHAGEELFRGFRLGTWDDTNGLPAGCRYADIGEDSRTIVTCDLTASDLLNNLGDPKGACRQIYAQNVVVHVDLPVSALSCEPPDDELGATCGVAPWNIGDEETGPDGGGNPPPTGECGVQIAEVFYDAAGADDGQEWIKLYNSCDETADLSGMSLGWGGADYTSGGLDLSGSIAGKGCFIVGGPESGADNGSPSIDAADNFSPDLQNSGAEADGVALFDVASGSVDGSTVPVDAVVYGEINTAGLLGPNGEAAEPHVGDAPEGSSIGRADASSWRINETPTPNDCPTF